MESRKKNRTVKKSKKYKMTKRTWIIFLSLILIICLGIFSVIYLNSEKHEKNRMEKMVSKWAEEYYTEELVNIASGYIKAKTQNNESVYINLDALKNFGKNIEIIKNSKTNQICDDVNSYVSIRVDKDADDISKDYKIEKVVLDCFE